MLPRPLYALFSAHLVSIKQSIASSQERLLAPREPSEHEEELFVL